MNTKVNGTVGPRSQVWNAEQTLLAIEMHADLVAAKNSGIRGACADIGRRYLKAINSAGPDRTSWRTVKLANGQMDRVARSDWYNFKVANMNYVARMLGAPDFVVKGIPELPHTAMEHNNPQTDPALWAGMAAKIRRLRMLADAG